jgi:hypothetical protein
MTPAVGVPLGLVYALVWMGAASRAARHGDPLRAGFDGATALAIGFPLIVEAALRFALLTPALAAASLAAFTGVMLLVAWRDRP